MKKPMFILPFVLALAGCFSTPSPQPAQWTVECPAGSAYVCDSPKFGTCRLLQVAVRAPYDSKSIAVMRGDGSLAFDRYNRFSAAPSALIKGAAIDALRKSGTFKAVVDSTSSAGADINVELVATRLALDCREKGCYSAVAEFSLTLIERRKFVKSVTAKGEAPVGDGNYTKAFSAALSDAFDGLVRRL